MVSHFAGLRTAEIEWLDWRKVNLAGKFIEVKAKKAKTRARRLVPITPNLGAWLEKRGIGLDWQSAVGTSILDFDADCTEGRQSLEEE